MTVTRVIPLEDVKKSIRELMEESHSQYFMRRDIQEDNRENVIDWLIDEYTRPLLAKLGITITDG